MDIKGVTSSFAGELIEASLDQATGQLPLLSRKEKHHSPPN
jgi:hypothetical protein